MALSVLETILRGLAFEFAKNLVGLAAKSSMDAMAEIAPASTTPPTPEPEPARPAPEAPQFIEVDLTAGPTKVRLVTPTLLDRVRAIPKAVASVPWPARSRELQVMLGLSKTQFVRVALIAVQMGLVHRTGQRAGIQYYLGPDPDVVPAPQKGRRRRSTTVDAKKVKSSV